MYEIGDCRHRFLDAQWWANMKSDLEYVVFFSISVIENLIPIALGQHTIVVYYLGGDYGTSSMLFIRKRHGHPPSTSQHPVTIMVCCQCPSYIVMFITIPSTRQHLGMLVVKHPWRSSYLIATAILLLHGNIQQLFWSWCAVDALYT